MTRFFLPPRPFGTRNCGKIRAMASFTTDDLVCPVCKEPLTLNAEKEGLACRKCRRIYPIRDGIPVLLVDEAVTGES
jgi:uncharacterized protein YbaR (Trm112 family)